MYPLTLILHGGAGTILKSRMTPEREAQYRRALQQALDAGFAQLRRGAGALDAVEAAVRELEDSPLFNAGRGSVFTADGTHEMDAAIMEGSERRAGAVALVRQVRNPVSLARKVMEHSAHVLLAGEGAEQFAREQQCDLQPPEYFYDDFRYQQWQEIRGSDTVQLDHSPEKGSRDQTGNGEKKFGTVGAVALDRGGNLAAATSTGGMTNKRFGRIGDSPLIGAGTYASNASCAVSCTGSGEFFIRGVVAYDLSCLMEYKGLSLGEAARKVVHEHLPSIGGDGGLIAVDRKGHRAMEYNSEGMYRAFHTESESGTAIYGDETNWTRQTE